MTVYFDTAYILKCYVMEHGWEKVRSLAQDCGHVACSVFGRLELHVALHRKLREGELSERQLNIILRQLSVDESISLWQWLPLTPTIFDTLTDTFSSLSRDAFLRTGDAVHLISAKMGGFSEIYSNDKHLLAAAPYVGMTGRDVIKPSDLQG